MPLNPLKLGLLEPSKSKTPLLGYSKDTSPQLSASSSKFSKRQVKHVTMNLNKRDKKSETSQV